MWSRGWTSRMSRSRAQPRCRPGARRGRSSALDQCVNGAHRRPARADCARATSIDAAAVLRPHLDAQLRRLARHVHRHSPEMRWVLVAVTGLIALVVIVWMLREKQARRHRRAGAGARRRARQHPRPRARRLRGRLRRPPFRRLPPVPDLQRRPTPRSPSACVIILARSLFMREKPRQPHSEPADPPADQPAETH